MQGIPRELNPSYLILLHRQNFITFRFESVPALVAVETGIGRNVLNAAPMLSRCVLT